MKIKLEEKGGENQKQTDQQKRTKKQVKEEDDWLDDIIFIGETKGTTKLSV